MSDPLAEFFKDLLAGGAGVLDGQVLGGLALVATFMTLAAVEAWRPMVDNPVEARGRLTTNFMLGLLNMALAALLPLTAPAAAAWAAGEGVGLFNLFAPPAWANVAITLLAASLSQYAFHRAAHAWPWLWRLHRAHHSDTAVDLSTTLRNHPLELLALVPWQCAVAVAMGASATTLLVYQTAVVAFGLWTHANLRLGPRADRWLRTVVVTPTMHHRHHSATRGETDSNFGDVLPHWDRLFGTYDDADVSTVAAMRRGLGDDADVHAAALRRQLTEAFGRR